MIDRHPTPQVQNGGSAWPRSTLEQLFSAFNPGTFCPERPPVERTTFVSKEMFLFYAWPNMSIPHSRELIQAKMLELLCNS